MRRAELLLAAGGSVCLAICCAAAVASWSAGRSAQLLAAAAAGEADKQATVSEHAGFSGEVMARLEIPQLQLSVPILNDYDTGSLLKGIGHIPGTALPGGLGTVGLAGHRDTYFRPLAGIQRAMDIRIVTAGGTWHYSVDSTEIVKPENVEVLDIRDQPALTLVTCYPFHYVGAAPLRFIVHAHLLSVIPDRL